MRQIQSRSQSSWSHYAKVAAIFTLSTATYLLARTTGWLSGWFSREKFADLSKNTNALSESSTMEAFVIVPLTERGEGDFQTEGFTDLSTTKEDSDQPQAQSNQRHLLQQQSSIIAINPIPDQIIEVGKPYSYSLDNVFSGNFTRLDAVERGKTNLPSWLSLQYKLVGSFRFLNCQNIKISGNLAFVSSYQSGIQILDISVPSVPRLLSSYPASFAMDVAISRILRDFPRLGRHMIDGRLRSQGIRVPRSRIRASRIRIRGRIPSFARQPLARREYHVAGVNSLWHHDGQHGERIRETLCCRPEAHIR